MHWTRTDDLEDRIAKLLTNNLYFVTFFWSNINFRDSVRLFRIPCEVPFERSAFEWDLIRCSEWSENVPKFKFFYKKMYFVPIKSYEILISVKKNCALQFLTCEKSNAQCILRGEDALVNASPGWRCISECITRGWGCISKCIITPEMHHQIHSFLFTYLIK